MVKREVAYISLWEEGALAALLALYASHWLLNGM